MTRPLSIGVAGLGTVGAGVLTVLRRNADIIAARAGRPIAVTAVAARDRTRDRGVKLDGLRWYEDPVAMAADSNVDVIVELIGGSAGPAKALVEAALSAGKPVVTANKALLARAKVAVAPGLGFGEHGDTHVRIAMVENTQRIRQALRGIRGFLQGDNAGPAMEPTAEGAKA